MGYRNSPAYVQRMIDRILRPFRGFARAYVDDIVIFSSSLEEHARHLFLVFEKLASVNICLAPTKSYLGYPSVALLGQKVDALGLSTAEEKLAPISKLAFPRNLRQLETYLGMTGFLRQYIPYYAAIVKPLQLRKTVSNKTLRETTAGGNSRKKIVGRLGVTVPTPRELRASHYLQSLFSRPSTLVHHDPRRQMYIDMDGSKARGHGAYAYHVLERSGSPMDLRVPNRSSQSCF